MSTPSGPFVPPSNGGSFVPPPAQPSYGQQQPHPPAQQQPYPPAQQPGYPPQPQPQQQPTSWRTLTLDMKQAPWYGWTWLQPTVTIDGYAYAAGWGRLNYQVPADRPVYVQCHINYLWAYGKAAAVLEPWHTAHLEYTAPANAWFAGDMGAPGSTKANGKAAMIAILSVMGALIGLSFALMIGLVVLGGMTG